MACKSIEKHWRETTARKCRETSIDGSFTFALSLSAEKEGYSMESWEVEQEAKKYKRFLERQTIIHFQLMDKERKWWMVEYGGKSGEAKGFAIYAEGNPGREDKISALDHFISTLRSVINIQTFIAPRIAVTKETEEMFGKIRKGLAVWMGNEQQNKLTRQFNDFADLVLWYQGKMNQVYEEYQMIGKRMDETQLFTPDDREDLILIGSKLDLLMYLQVKAQYDWLEANRSLLESLQKDKNGLANQEHSFLVSCLTNYCDASAKKDYERSLFNKEELIWKDEIATKESYERLLNSSLQKYRESDRRRLDETIPMLRN